MNKTETKKETRYAAFWTGHGWELFWYRAASVIASVDMCLEINNSRFDIFHWSRKHRYTATCQRAMW